MNIIVCVKHVPDTESKIKIAGDSTSYETAGLEYIVNPYDEFAVEEALKIKEAKGGEVTVILLGPENATKTIRTCLAMGADKAVHLVDENPLRDAAAIAGILADAIKSMPHDIVFFGKQSVDMDNAQVGLMVAGILGIPAVSEIASMECGDGSAVVKRSIEGGVEVYEVPFPAVFTTQKGLNDPRYASLKGIMAAKKKPIENTQFEDRDPCITITKLDYPPARPPGKIVGEGAEAVPQLFELLKNEAKVL
jgi:electron transfer flavoprotein beta subunit